MFVTVRNTRKYLNVVGKVTMLSESHVTMASALLRLLMGIKYHI
jgi:hypothetical protein